MEYLPPSNDPGCSAGFAHGLVTAVAPEIDPRKPRQAASVCARAGTRYQRYSCTHGFGHAFMRLLDDRLEPALGLCAALGHGSAPDCAQGAYHDYWFAVAGVDDASLKEEPVTEPRALCAVQPRQFVRPCWYRAFIDSRPDGFRADSTAALDRLCEGLHGLQRAACVTAASVIGPPDPAAQLPLCAGFAASSDAESCIRGTKVQNLLGQSDRALVDLTTRCEIFSDRTRVACYRWLGKVLSVLTDGRFPRSGCARLVAPDARTACRAGARSATGPLVTFS